MAFGLQSLRLPAGDDIYYDPDFRKMVEHHIPLLKSDRGSVSKVVTPTTVLRFEGDFYGLLSFYEIPQKHHWITLRINSLLSPDEYGREIRDPYAKKIGGSIRVPIPETIDDLRGRYLNSR